MRIWLFQCGRLWWPLAVALVAWSAALPAGEAEPPKAAVPDAAAQEQALKLVAEIYRETWDAAKTSPERTALAARMIAEAEKPASDQAGRFVLLRVARDIAAEAGDAATACRAIDLMAAGFVVDPAAMKAEAVTAAAEQARLPQQHLAIAEHTIPLVEGAVARDDYEAASRLVRLAQAAARKTADVPLGRQLADLARRVQDLAKAYEALRPALATLEQRAADPAANLAVGRYYCLVKGDWDRGLPMLALGSDEALRGPALAELRGPAGADEQVALADTWWDLAQRFAAGEKRHVLEHAGALYRQARPRLPAGLVRTKVEKRLEEIAALDPIAAAAGPGPRLTSHEVDLPLNEPWPFRLDVKRGQTVRIAATGRWRVQPRGKWHQPDDPQFYLQGRFDSGQPFRVGARFAFRVPANGALSLGMYENGTYDNNSGQIRVVLEVRD